MGDPVVSFKRIGVIKDPFGGADYTLVEINDRRFVIKPFFGGKQPKRSILDSNPEAVHARSSSVHQK